MLAKSLEIFGFFFRSSSCRFLEGLSSPWNVASWKAARCRLKKSVSSRLKKLGGVIYGFHKWRDLHKIVGSFPWENPSIWVNFITTSLFSRTLEIMVRIREIIPFYGRNNSGEWNMIIYPDQWTWHGIVMIPWFFRGMTMEISTFQSFQPSFERFGASQVFFFGKSPCLKWWKNT